MTKSRRGGRPVARAAGRYQTTGAGGSKTSRPLARPASGFDRLLEAALERRRALRQDDATTAYRLLNGGADGMPGVAVDCYGPGAVLIVTDDAGQSETAVARLARETLAVLAPLGVVAVYAKPFTRDRSRGGGARDPRLFDPRPLAGEPLPEAIAVREHGFTYEVRLHDGFSTGLFLDQRDNRRALAALGATEALNLFAYTCAFAVPLTAAGAAVTNVDVAPRALEWGRRNLIANGLDAEHGRMVRLDARRFVRHALRRGLRYDLTLVDPPTFGAANPRRDVPAWSIARDLPALLREVSECLLPGGRLFVATNHRPLCRPRELERLVRGALPGCRLLSLPPAPIDFSGEPVSASLLVIPG